MLDMPLLDTRRGKDLMGTFLSDIVLQVLSSCRSGGYRGGKSLWNAPFRVPGPGSNLWKSHINVNGQIYGNVYISVDLPFLGYGYILPEKMLYINTFVKIISNKLCLRKSTLFRSVREWYPVEVEGGVNNGR